MNRITKIILIGIGIFMIGLLGFVIFKVLKTKDAQYTLSLENTWKTEKVQNFGIDISHYQGRIDWKELKNSTHDINYIFIRSTMGKDGKDRKFQKNWANAKKNEFLRGAYHYYRPSENSVRQFENFSRSVNLEPGDLPPVLDIEEMSIYGKENLIAGITNWLRLAKEHYGVTPIVYTGADFYRSYLKGHIEDYPLWIAAYSGSNRLKGIDWKFHQFSDKIRVKGIRSEVDGNSFKGELSELIKLGAEENDTRSASRGANRNRWVPTRK